MNAETKGKLSSPWGIWASKLVLFCGCAVYTELALHILLFTQIDSHIVYPLLFGGLAGCLTTLIVGLLPKTLQRIAGVLLVLLQVLLAEVQLIYHAVFGNLMALNQLSMGGGVLKNFLGQTLYAMGQNWLGILVLLAPLGLVIGVLCRKKLRRKTGWKQALASLGLALLAGLAALAGMRLICWHPVSAWELFRSPRTTTDMSYRSLGMNASTGLELRYMLFGRGETQKLDWDDQAVEPVSYDPAEYNVLPGLDLLALSEQTEDPELAAMDRYFAAQVPTKKNAYTGRMKDWNVIELCAESYSPLFLSPELTPTLCKMSQEGLVFDNYYGTFNSMTTNGEYTTCLSLFPDMERTKVASSFDMTVGHSLPFCLGTALKNLGYSTWAFHNNIPEFYNRIQTHPNMGYTFIAGGTGLDMEFHHPSSDREMMEASMDYYLNAQEPFHAYYMTISGHYQYNWDNAMSARNREKVEALPYSDPVKAYIACNLEVEYAMEYILQRLEEAGKLNNTVIVLTNDHYPYGLSEDQYNELAGRKIDTVYEKYHNHFICYAPGLGETVHIPAYCCTADILPTLLNLLGVEYDSRLLAGRDVLSDCPHAAILSDGSFLTDDFRFDEATGTLTPADPAKPVDAETLSRWRREISNRFILSRQILYTDYFAHILGVERKTDHDDTLAFQFNDVPQIRKQANILLIYSKGYIDLYDEKQFGPDEPCTVGDFLTAIYRYKGKPETDESALPADYQAGDQTRLEAFRASPHHDAICWAFSQGLLKPEDRLTAWDDLMTNVEICLLMRRTVEYLGHEGAQQDLEIPPLPENLTEEEREAVIWAIKQRIIRYDGSLEGIFDPEGKQIWEDRNPLVTRYRLCIFLTRALYPELNR